MAILKWYPIPDITRNRDESGTYTVPNIGKYLISSVGTTITVEGFGGITATIDSAGALVLTESSTLEDPFVILSADRAGDVSERKVGVIITDVSAEEEFRWDPLPPVTIATDASGNFTGTLLANLSDYLITNYSETITFSVTGKSNNISTATIDTMFDEVDISVSGLMGTAAGFVSVRASITIGGTTATVDARIDVLLLLPSGGQPGATGKTGADSTVPGPASMVPGPASTIPGKTGKTGADSQVPGPVGKTGADSQVPGPVGKTGADGDSIVGKTGLESTIPGITGKTGADSTIPGGTGKTGLESTIPGVTGKTGLESTIPGATGVTGRTGTFDILTLDDIDHFFGDEVGASGLMYFERNDVDNQMDLHVEGLQLVLDTITEYNVVAGTGISVTSHTDMSGTVIFTISTS